MIYNIVRVPNYLLALDHMDFQPCVPPNICMAHKTFPCDKCGRYNGLKVIGHRPLNNAKPLNGVPQLPPTEDSWERMFEKTFPCIDKLDKETASHFRDGFMEGYKSRGGYTQKDIWKVLFLVNDKGIDPWTDRTEISNIIESLFITPTAFQATMTINVIEDNHGPETTTIEHDMLVGRYIYDNKVVLKKSSILRDGGTKVYIEDGSEMGLKTIKDAQTIKRYYLDGRFDSPTKGDLFDRYPKEDGAIMLDKSKFIIND